TGSWAALSAFAALPFTFGETNLSFADAYFEAISGLTSTGATILVGLDRMPPGVLLWRAVLQWMGGIGIIATAVAMLPFLRVGGRDDPVRRGHPCDDDGVHRRLLHLRRLAGSIRDAGDPLDRRRLHARRRRTLRALRAGPARRSGRALARQPGADPAGHGGQ